MSAIDSDVTVPVRTRAKRSAGVRDIDKNWAAKRAGKFWNILLYHQMVQGAGSEIRIGNVEKTFILKRIGTLHPKGRRKFRPFPARFLSMGKATCPGKAFRTYVRARSEKSDGNKKINCRRPNSGDKIL